MSHRSEPDPKTGSSLKELFAFWQSLKNDVQEGNSYLEAIKIEEIQLILYERLSALSRQIIYAMVRQCRARARHCLLLSFRRLPYNGVVSAPRLSIYLRHRR